MTELQRDDLHTVVRPNTKTLDTKGYYIFVPLPSGITLKFWVYENAATTSVDVSATRNGDALNLENVLRFPSNDTTRAAAVVIENRSIE